MEEVYPELETLCGRTLYHHYKVFDLYIKISEETGIGFRKESGTEVGKGGVEGLIVEAGVCVILNGG